MQQISDISNSVDMLAKSHAQPAISLEAKELINSLFVVLVQHVKYFKLNQGDNIDAAKREWTKTFFTCSITKEQVLRGIERLRKSDVVYPNITPAEFLALCAIKPSDIGAPDVNAAYLEACQNNHPSIIDKKWSHKTVRYAMNKTGSYFLRNEPKHKTFPEFAKHYADACTMFSEGKILEQIGHDSPLLRREIEETQKIVAKGFESFNSPFKALTAIKDMLK